MRRRLLTIGLLALTALTACQTARTAACPAVDPSTIAEAGLPRPVIVDLDMAQEDMDALLFLLQHPGVEVLAVTVSGTGEAHCAPGVRHALALLDLHGAGNIPVACGPETPLGLDHAFPAEWRTNVDSLYGLSLPESDRQSSGLDAPALIGSIAGQAGQPVDIVAVGPLTNIAAALLDDPTLADHISSIFIMGGAVEVPGNVGQSGVGIDNERAEWNFYADPPAARIVLESGIPITLVPLDATADAPVTSQFVRCLGDRAGTPEAAFVFDLLSANSDFVESGGFQFWDSLTAAVYTDESIASYETLTLTVVDGEGPDSGAVIETDGGSPVRVALSADRARFEQLFVTVLNQE